jgi:2-keto-4-pentenoate hydratase/2-oxohepta-3-ene-1,7-dioic acid hydratase in catechol pathway
MRLIRFISAGRVYLGKRLDATTASRLVGDPLVSTIDTGERLTIDQLLAPIVPTDILCIGLNYRAHAAESKSQIPDNPMLFIKASNALNHPGEPIKIPRRSSMIDYEGELAVVIGRDAKNVSKADALRYVFGYTIANDVSARDWQREKSLGGGQFARGKSFDGFCPLGPDIVTADEAGDPNQLMLKTTLNGQVMQEKSTGDMIFDVPTLIESLSSTMTIRAGSVILTGTPEGVGFARTPPVWLKAGDRVSIEIEKIGRLENTVEAES